MKKLLLILVLVAFSNLSVAAETAENDSAYGTYSTIFQPAQRSGELIGCNLVYRALHPDHAYRKGNPVVVNGYFGLLLIKEDLYLTLKIGLMDVTKKPSFEGPHFSYLQTESYSTIKAKNTKPKGVDGYSLYMYSMYSPEILGLLDEIQSSRKVTIGFNRREKGLDVIVPIDLEVIESKKVGDKVIRKRSGETMLNFSRCSSTLTEKMMDILEKKAQ